MFRGFLVVLMMLSGVARLAGLDAGGEVVQGFIPLAVLAKFAPAIIGGVGGALKNRKAARTGTATSTATPGVAPEVRPLFDELMRNRLAALQQPSGLPPGFMGQGIANINQTTDASQMGLENFLTSRGLGGSPVAGTGFENLLQRRGADINQFQNVTAPLMERDFGERDFAAALQLFQSLPATQATTGSSTAPGSALGSGLGSAAALWALLSALSGKG
jgi:hypothetical protein